MFLNAILSNYLQNQCATKVQSVLRALILVKSGCFIDRETLQLATSIKGYEDASVSRKVVATKDEPRGVI